MLLPIVCSSLSYAPPSRMLLPLVCPSLVSCAVMLCDRVLTRGVQYDDDEQDTCNDLDQGCLVNKDGGIANPLAVEQHFSHHPQVKIESPHDDHHNHHDTVTSHLSANDANVLDLLSELCEDSYQSVATFVAITDKEIKMASCDSQQHSPRQHPEHHPSLQQPHQSQPSRYLDAMKPTSPIIGNFSLASSTMSPGAITPFVKVKNELAFHALPQTPLHPPSSLHRNQHHHRQHRHLDDIVCMSQPSSQGSKPALTSSTTQPHTLVRPPSHFNSTSLVRYESRNLDSSSQDLSPSSSADVDDVTQDDPSSPPTLSEMSRPPLPRGTQPPLFEGEDIKGKKLSMSPLVLKAAQCQEYRHPPTIPPPSPTPQSIPSSNAHSTVCHASPFVNVSQSVKAQRCTFALRNNTGPASHPPSSLSHESHPGSRHTSKRYDGNLTPEEKWRRALATMKMSK
jgi:hypothetical protein